MLFNESCTSIIFVCDRKYIGIFNFSYYFSEWSIKNAKHYKLCGKYDLLFICTVLRKILRNKRYDILYNTLSHCNLHFKFEENIK